MTKLKDILKIGTLGLASLISTGCEDNAVIEKELTSGKIDNVSLKVTDYREVLSGNSDRLEYKIEVYDSDGKIRAQFISQFLPEGFIQYDDKKVDLRNGVVVEDTSKLNNQGEQ